LTFSRENLSA